MLCIFIVTNIIIIPIIIHICFKKYIGSESMWLKISSQWVFLLLYIKVLHAAKLSNSEAWKKKKEIWCVIELIRRGIMIYNKQIVYMYILIIFFLFIWTILRNGYFSVYMNSEFFIWCAKCCFCIFCSLPIDIFFKKIMWEYVFLFVDRMRGYLNFKRNLYHVTDKSQTFNIDLSIVILHH